MIDYKVLVVEDDPSLLEVLRYNLTKEGYTTLTAVTGNQAVDTIQREKLSLVILDVMLPGMSGFEVCRIVRKETQIPVIMLTARADEMDKITGLDLGADDYMTKPFSMRELLARVRAMLRRSEMSRPPAEQSPSLQAGTLMINIARHQASMNGKELSLTPKEFDLLAFLTANQKLVFNREQLLEKVWGYDYAGDSRTVDVHIRWLREKIESDPAHPQHLITVRGAGYKLEA